MRKIFASIAAAAALLVFANGASAIVYGQPDGSRHPVGRSNPFARNAMWPHTRNTISNPDLGLIWDSRCLTYKQKPPIYGGFRSG
jgi:hypothetical protein